MPSIRERQTAVVEEFAGLDGWEARYKRLIERGRALAGLPEELKDDEHKVRGCQSQVWLRASRGPDGALEFSADSDALIVKGLVSLLLEAYSGARPSEILASPPDFLKSIGLDQHLSPSRANGLYAMAKQIMFYAAAFQAMERTETGQF